MNINYEQSTWPCLQASLIIATYGCMVNYADKLYQNLFITKQKFIAANEKFVQYSH